MKPGVDGGTKVGTMRAMNTPRGIVTCLPDVACDELIGVAEVLIQERLPSFAVPVAVLGELRAVFAARATLGAWQVSDVGQLERAVDAGADFVFADRFDGELASLAREAGVAVYASACTPTEVRSVLAGGAAGALLWPADVVGHTMAGHLARVGLIDRVIPMGGLGAYAASQWLESGAPAAAVDATLLGDAAAGGDLGQLRDRCGAFRKLQPES